MTIKKVTGTLARLEELKHVASEPRGAGEAFDRAVSGYYDAVKAGRGALLLALCRGKVRACLITRVCR